MAQLPVPELNTTLTQFIEWLRPLVDEKTLQNSRVAAETFAAGTGKDLQAQLTALAGEKAPDSWLIEAWRAQSLANRDSLPLSSNIAMRIEWQATQTGLKRVAHFVSALVQVHADYRRQQSTDEKDSVDEDAMCRLQQRILLGASRRPQANLDKYVFNDDQQSTAHIVVLCRGYAWKINVLDEKGGIASPAQLDNVIHRILTAYDQEAEIAFAAPSVLPAEQACEIRAQLICRGDNSHIWQIVEQALFILSLDETHHHDTDSALTDTLLNDGSGIWAYKPLNYRCYLGDDRYYVHFERAWADVGCIADIIARAQAHYDAQNYPRKNQLPMDLGLTPLNWHIEEQTRLLLKEQFAEYTRRAEGLRICHTELTLSEEDLQSMADYSKDAICQLLLQYAQYNAFGELHNTGEMVDMRHFENGRTECLRVVSKESIALINALIEGRADVRKLYKFNEAHHERINVCKQGKGIHGHLLALAALATEQGIDDAFFADNGYQMLVEDTFFTISLGDNEHIGHIAFAPTCKNGFGVNYGIRHNHLTFVIIYRRSNGENIRKFITELESGLKRLLLVLRDK